MRKCIPVALASVSSSFGGTLDDSPGGCFTFSTQFPGVFAENVLDVLRMGIDSALLGMGVESVHDLQREHLVIPDGFERRLGAD